ncbi:sulfatase-like hydrolase/transferase [Bradyrhizobium sp. STM 3562]|uniref:sulfatase-like hydrolase/transferase n=1 Tax=Bradyrhizobium sp. STM 3562 TaxID=578924 RepID=UPI00388CFCC6
MGAHGDGELRGAPTPRLDQLAREGLRLTQFLVEPACTPWRAASMTARYSVHNGLSMMAVKAKAPYTFLRVPSQWVSCSRNKATPRQSSASGVWVANHGACHAHGFDEFYRIRPAISWDAASASMAGYPKAYNIGMDPHEDLVVAGLFGWISEPSLKVVEQYL